MEEFRKNIDKIDENIIKLTRKQKARGANGGRI